MKVAGTKKNFLLTCPKKFFAAGKAKKLDPSLKEFDVIAVGGINTANMIKYFQHKHFHGTMAGFCHGNKFYFESLYPQAQFAEMKLFKYGTMNFGGNCDARQSKVSKDTITQILPEKNQVVSSKGEVFTYKTLVLNTGINQKPESMPFLLDHIKDDWAKTRVFVHQPNDSFHLNRNMRIRMTHKDGDFLLYIPDGPSKMETNTHWYLMLDTYFTRGQFTDNRSRAMRLKVITPRNYLFKFPFAEAIVQEEIEKRSMIGKILNKIIKNILDLHFGMELVNVELKQTYYGFERVAVFKDLKTGQEVRMNFGSLLVTPKSQKREMYEGNDIADEDVSIYINIF
jgi:hypothetical protein